MRVYICVCFFWCPRWHAKRCVATYYDIFLFRLILCIVVKQNARQSKSLDAQTQASRSVSTFFILRRKLFLFSVGLERKSVQNINFFVFNPVGTGSAIAVFIICFRDPTYFVALYHLFNQIFGECR